MQVSRPSSRNTKATPRVFPPTFCEHSIGEEPKRQCFVYQCRTGMARDEGLEALDCLIRSPSGERYDGAVDCEQFIVGRTLARPCQQRLRVLVSTLLAINHRKVIGDIGALGVEVVSADTAPLCLAQVFELEVGLGKVEMRVGAIRALLQRAFETAHGLLGLLRLAVGDAEGIEIVRIAPARISTLP